MHHILFLCTGNYYRSRIAEEVFNAYSHREQLSDRAISRGLGSQWPNLRNPGPISRNAKQFLSSIGIDTGPSDRMPLPCLEEDLAQATHVICLSQREHKAMFAAKFPDYPIEQVTFWEIGDVGVQAVQDAMDHIHQQTLRLIADLKNTQAS